MRNSGWISENESSAYSNGAGGYTSSSDSPARLGAGTFKNWGTIIRKQTGRFQHNLNANRDNAGSPAPSKAHHHAVMDTFGISSPQIPSKVASPAQTTTNNTYNNTTNNTPSTSDPHPYTTLSPPRGSNVHKHDLFEDDAECPVCLEPLSFSFRLPGEKPHIVPECGHALHEACFSAVYGPPPGQARAGGVPRKANLGVCGVCRRQMKVSDGDAGSKSNKLASLTGMGESHNAAAYPGRGSGAPLSKDDDDPIEAIPKVSPSQSNQSSSVTVNDSGYLPSYIITPTIQVRPEFHTVTRRTDKAQPLTCIVVVELPGKRRPGELPPPPVPHAYATGRTDDASPGTSTPRQTQPPRRLEANPPSTVTSRRAYSQDLSDIGSPPVSTIATQSFQQQQSQSQPSTIPPSSAPPYSEEEEEEEQGDGPFAAITEDLRARIQDWKGHPLEGLGRLQMYDLLSVRRDALVREFFVYLFKEALICVVEEKKRNNSNFASPSANPPTKGVMKLKGRIYVRHIRKVTAVTTPSPSGEMTLTIDMEDERLDSFVLIFKERTTLDAWKNQIQNLVDHFHGVVPAAPATVSTDTSYDGSGSVTGSGGTEDGDEFGTTNGSIRHHSMATSTNTNTNSDSLLNGSAMSVRSTQSSSTSYGSSSASRHYPSASTAVRDKLSTLGEDDELAVTENDYDDAELIAPQMPTNRTNLLTPLSHPHLDLIIVLSIPPPTAVASTAALKIRVIKSTLDFILTSLGPKDRLSLVTFEVGLGGQVRKTPFLAVGKESSKERLRKFIDGTGNNSANDEFIVRGTMEEKTDVVTAVNHGLDVVLQRKAKNPISSMILVSDASDSTRRAHMDLVLARAEAANVGIHSFGYGRSHDPASLWLMSNHTSGTYTFVKDWYDLRECVAGCVGGMMSVGLLNFKLHIHVVDGLRFKIRKVSGGPSSVVATSGHDVDVDVGELRFGERKEMLIELDLEHADPVSYHDQKHGGHSLNATDAFVQSMGLEALGDGLGGGEFMDGMLDRMIDDIPVFEIDGSFFDPAAGRQVTRLPHPVLLTITVQPIPPSIAPISDPVIVRRRMELLASDMITRALVLVSRRNFQQAQKIMGETKRILQTVHQSVLRTVQNGNTPGGIGTKQRREQLTIIAARSLQAIMQDLQILSEALEENKELFAHDQRNLGAQQAMILRDQKSWTGRSATERLFWTTDNSVELVQRSLNWTSRY